MNSKTRKYIDESQAYVSTMDVQSLWNYFKMTDKFVHKPGKPLKGFMPDWIGEFYAYYQWFFDLSSASVLLKIPVSYLEMAYPGLHDLELDLAVRKVGKA
ncbi:MAG: hypothetical protein WC117_04450 [Sphaerochaetaceae bacterium]|nr:hypothetical protein [Sphaerochaetaceae bacterium]